MRNGPFKVVWLRVRREADGKSFEHNATEVQHVHLHGTFHGSFARSMCSWGSSCETASPNLSPLHGLKAG